MVGAFPEVRYTKKELADIGIAYNDSINAITDRLGIKAFIGIASLCNLSFSDWMNLSVYERYAFTCEFNEIQEKRESERKQYETQQRLRMQEEQFKNRKR